MRTLNSIQKQANVAAYRNEIESLPAIFSTIFVQFSAHDINMIRSTTNTIGVKFYFAIDNTNKLNLVAVPVSNSNNNDVDGPNNPGNFIIIGGTASNSEIQNIPVASSQSNLTPFNDPAYSSANTMIQNFRNRMPVRFSTMIGNRSRWFSNEDLSNELAGASGLKCYFSINTNGNDEYLDLILCGVNANGSDMLDIIHASYIAQGIPCPPECGQNAQWFY